MAHFAPRRGAEPFLPLPEQHVSDALSAPLLPTPPEDRLVRGGFFHGQHPLEQGFSNLIRVTQAEQDVRRRPKLPLTPPRRPASHPPPHPLYYATRLALCHRRH